MYIRFEGQQPNPDSASKLGIFQLAFQLRDEGDIPRYAEEMLIKNLEWLREHLKSPKILKEDGYHRAISWFKPTAKEPIKRIRAIASVLEEYGYHISQVKTKEPGSIIYEDGFQIVAIPKRAKQSVK